MILTLALTRHVQADGDLLAKARASIESLDYMAARTTLAEALATGTNGPDELTEIYLLTGVVSGALGDSPASAQAFQKLLALSPKASLVAGTSPRVTRPFAEATAFYRTHAPLKVSVQSAISPPMVTLVVESDPMAMITGARVVVIADGKPEQTLDAKGTARIAIALPDAKRLELRVIALDEHGNRLVELGAPNQIVIVTPDKPVLPPVIPVVVKPLPPPAARPLYAQWWLWGGVSAAAAVTGTLFGLGARSAGNDLEALNAASMAHDFGEAQDVLARARRNALLANITFGAAGATAVAAVILFVTRPDARSRERSITVVPTPIRGGTAITLEVPF